MDKIGLMEIKDKKIGEFVRNKTVSWSRVLDDETIISNHIGTVVGLKLLEVDNKCAQVNWTGFVLVDNVWTVIHTNFIAFVVFSTIHLL